MTDSKPKNFEDDLPGEDKRFYSVNFLLARFASTGESQGRQEQLPQDYLQSRHYGSRDFAVVRFNKNISTPLRRYGPATGEDE